MGTKKQTSADAIKGSATKNFWLSRNSITLLAEFEPKWAEQMELQEKILDNDGKVTGLGEKKVKRLGTLKEHLQAQAEERNIQVSDQVREAVDLYLKFAHLGILDYVKTAFSDPKAVDLDLMEFAVSKLKKASQNT